MISSSSAEARRGKQHPKVRVSQLSKKVESRSNGNPKKTEPKRTDVESWSVWNVTEKRKAMSVDVFFNFKFIFSTVTFTYLLSDAQQNTSPEMNSGKKPQSKQKEHPSLWRRKYRKNSRSRSHSVKSNLTRKVSQVCEVLSKSSQMQVKWRHVTLTNEFYNQRFIASETSKVINLECLWIQDNHSIWWWPRSHDDATWLTVKQDDIQKLIRRWHSETWRTSKT